MITVKNLSKHFGGIKAVDGVDLHIDRGSITGLVGPNGAGKTTMFNLIAGLYQPTEGEIILDGENVTELSSHQLFHKGLLRTFQIAHEFPTLSVLENLMMVPANQLGEHLMNTWLKRKQIQEEEKILQEKAEGVIDFLNISHLKNERAGNLSGGQKKLLELARTMMVDAKVVLLDEVGAGVHRTLLKQIGDAIFALVNLARFLGIPAEDALRKTNNKFINRFKMIEMELKKRGKTLEESSLDEMDEIWNAEKRKS